ncbi:MAG: ABC transporter ATP-binding protein [Nitrospirae bacterium]|nr:ABC transporter ATP-binding protein [Nitrospirota bacterium]
MRFKIFREWHLGKALRLVWQSTPNWTIASAVLIILQGALPLLTLYLMKLIVDAVTAGIASPDKTEAFKQVLYLIGLAGIATIFSTLCSSIAGVVNEQQTQMVSDYMNSIIHAKSVEVDLEYYENPKYHDTLQRAQREGPFRPGKIVNGLVQFCQNSISLVAMASLLITLHWGIAAVLFLTVVPGIFVRVKYSHRIYDWQRTRTSAERKAAYFHWMLTGEAHAKEIRLFDLGSLFMQRFQNLRVQLRKERLGITSRRSIAELITQTFCALAVLASYLFIAYRTVQGLLTMGDLVMYYQAFQRGQSFMKSTLNSMADLYEDNLFLSNLYEFLELKPKVTEPSHPKRFPAPMQTGIVFDSVDFIYPGNKIKALDDISLTIRPGEVIALVGENGSGKTTLVKLLCRLYDPSSGAITIDGINIQDFKITDLRREISVIFQDYARYHLTARENIWFGNIDMKSDDEQILHAARHAGIDDVIAGFENGYETVLGKWFEDGKELSIGEWQKIALARAFLRDTRMIILDEPTSSMDAKTEYKVFQKFRDLVQGRSAVIISHRFTTVRMADRIYVLSKGSIIEGGSHEELIRYGGKYARMFEMQAQAYR